MPGSEERTETPRLLGTVQTSGGPAGRQSRAGIRGDGAGQLCRLAGAVLRPCPCGPLQHAGQAEAGGPIGFLSPTSVYTPGCDSPPTAGTRERQGVQEGAQLPRAALSGAPRGAKRPLIRRGEPGRGRSPPWPQCVAPSLSGSPGKPSGCQQAAPSGAQADPSAHDKYLFKVFPVVSVINGPLMQSMNPVSRVNLQEALLTAHPTCPTAQNVGGGGGSGGRGGPP